MPKNVEKMTFNYSPNFDLKKRDKSKIKYLIYHYTGMKSEKGALRRLTNINSNVSCHYFIKKNGEIIKIVPELYVAWHAGISFWKKDRSLNKKSIGIEISNPGHQYGYESFKKKQLECLIKITKILIKKYSIKKKNILGHSDIAPLRKKDPGEKFPWKYLADKKIGIWHKIDSKKCLKLRGKYFNIKSKFFFEHLNKLGYSVQSSKKTELKKITNSFQRRFRPELINGKVDRECLEIAKSLISNK